MTEQPSPLDPRTRELTILNAVAQTLNHSVALEAALRATLAKAAELLNLHAGWIWLLNEENGEHYLAAAQNLPPVLAADPRKMEGWCHCVEAYLEGGLAEAENIDVITCTRLKGLVGGHRRAALPCQYSTARLRQADRHPQRRFGRLARAFERAT